MGWSSAGLKLASHHAKAVGLTALVVVHDGALILSWGQTNRRVTVRSVRKSLLSALYGIFAAEGKIKLEATLEQLGIDDHQMLTEQEVRATVRQLLQARSGVYHPAAYETRNMKRYRPRRGSHAPGTFFRYNNWDFNALGTIFNEQSGQDMFDAFDQRVARPLGMQDFRRADCRYHREPVSIHPGYQFKLSARDMARFGLLYLRQGRWRGRQIIPRKWIRLSTSAHSRKGRKGLGYGYMWWIGQRGMLYGNRVGRAYMAKGNGGQVVAVLPEQNLVLAQTVRWRTRRQKVPYEEFGEILRLVLKARKTR